MNATIFSFSPAGKQCIFDVCQNVCLQKIRELEKAGYKVYELDFHGSRFTKQRYDPLFEVIFSLYVKGLLSTEDLKKYDK